MLLRMPLCHELLRSYESIYIRHENRELIKQLNIEKKNAETALAEARAANMAKNHFLAAASHDLRQPLHALGLFLGSLALLVNDDKAQSLLQRIRATSDMLNLHFNSLLDLSRFDAGKIEVEYTRFELSQLLNNILEEQRPDAENKGLTLSASLSTAIVHSDPQLVARLVANLLSNAIRYTQHGTVTISSTPSEQSTLVQITDTGPGIAEADQAGIFDEFVQLHNPARQREQGVGLGLAIVQRINKLLHLDLQLHSRCGSGTRFEFRLPSVHDSGQTTPRSEQTLPPDITQSIDKDVWVIEDDAMVAEALQIQLHAWGCRVSLADSRATLEAIYQRSGRWPDIALIDDMLGEQESGLEIAEWLKQHLPAEQLIIVTGNTLPERLEEVNNAGFQVILKPMSPQQLLELLTQP